MFSGDGGGGTLDLMLWEVSDVKLLLGVQLGKKMGKTSVLNSASRAEHNSAANFVLRTCADVIYKNFGTITQKKPKKMPLDTL